MVRANKIDQFSRNLESMTKVVTVWAKKSVTYWESMIMYDKLSESGLKIEKVC